MEYLALLSTSGLYTFFSMSMAVMSKLGAAGEISLRVGQPAVLTLQGDVPGTGRGLWAASGDTSTCAHRSAQ